MKKPKDVLGKPQQIPREANIGAVKSKVEKKFPNDNKVAGVTLERSSSNFKKWLPSDRKTGNAFKGKPGAS